MHNIKKHKLILAALFGAFLLTGCGTTAEQREVAAFSTSIASFTDFLNDANEQINSLDTSQKESCDELLNILDNMDGEFEKLASLNVPDEYNSVKTLTEGASNNMSTAVSYYHKVYGGDTYDADDAQAAYEYYTRAMLEVECIGYVLANEEIPDSLLEDAGIHLTMQGETYDESVLNKWLGDSDEVIIENE